MLDALAIDYPHDHRWVFCRLYLMTLCGSSGNFVGMVLRLLSFQGEFHPPAAEGI